MLENMDTKDRRILLALDMDARVPESRIAKKVGLSKQVTNYRIKRLEKKGIIKGYTAVIDHSKLGMKVYKILISIENLHKEKEAALIEYIKEHASWAASVLGNWDIAFAVNTKDEYEFMDFWNSFYAEYGRFIKERNITMITSFWNFERSFILPKKKDRSKAFILGASRLAIISTTDRKILKQLSRHARMSSLQIAKAIGETERIVRYRIKRMEKEKIILGYRPFIDPSLLGMTFYKLFINLKDAKAKDIKTIREYITQHPDVGYSTETLGGPDFELEIYTRGSHELFRFINELKEQFPSFIKSAEHMEYIEEYKVTYYPGQEV